MVDVIVGGITLESGSFSVDHFYESVVCMREIEAVCIMNSCNRILLLVWIVVERGCGMSSVKCTMPSYCNG